MRVSSRRAARRLPHDHSCPRRRTGARPLALPPPWHEALGNDGYPRPPLPAATGRGWGAAPAWRKDPPPPLAHWLRRSSLDTSITGAQAARTNAYWLPRTPRSARRTGLPRRVPERQLAWARRRDGPGSSRRPAAPRSWGSGAGRTDWTPGSVRAGQAHFIRMACPRLHLHGVRVRTTVRTRRATSSSRSDSVSAAGGRWCHCPRPARRARGARGPSTPPPLTAARLAHREHRRSSKRHVAGDRKWCGDISRAAVPWQDLPIRRLLRGIHVGSCSCRRRRRVALRAGGAELLRVSLLRNSVICWCRAEERG